MNISSRISRWQLATIGVVCCIVGTRILLGIGNRAPVQEDPMPSQIQQQTLELLEDWSLEGDQSTLIPETDKYNPFASPTQ